MNSVLAALLIVGGVVIPVLCLVLAMGAYEDEYKVKAGVYACIGLAVITAGVAAMLERDSGGSCGPGTVEVYHSTGKGGYTTCEVQR